MLCALLAASGVGAMFGTVGGTASALVTTIYAAPTAVGAGTCADSADACTLPSALAQVTSGSTIDLLAGTYQPATNSSFTIGTSATLQPAVAGSVVTLQGNGAVVVAVGAGVTASITGLTITGGRGGGGGGINNGGTLRLSNSTVSGNTAAGGGGIWNFTAGSLAVVDSTISGNTATSSAFPGDGGGIFTDGTLTVESSTISGNTAPNGRGGGFWNGGGTATFASDLFASSAGPPAGGDCANIGVQGTTIDGGYNIDDDGTCQFGSGTGSHSGTSAYGTSTYGTVLDHYLGSLGAYGGPTQTVPLLSVASTPTALTDPAHGVVPASFTLPTGPAACSIPDQRGVARPTNNCDIGSYQIATAGYWEVASDGGVFSFNAPFEGSMASKPLNQPVVGMVGTSDGGGYWLVAKDGGIFSFGDAKFAGSMGGKPLNQPIVGMAADAATGGYWEVASDGGVFSFNAPFEGSMASKPLNQPVVGMVGTSDGGGYWLVAKDGGIFSFGDAKFAGSMGGKPLNQPIVGMAADAATGGYWEVASDGGVFSFNAPFEGSMASKPLNQPVVGMVGTSDGGGYWLVAKDGGIFSFGDAKFAGSMGGKPLNQPIVGMSAT